MSFGLEKDFFTDGEILLAKTPEEYKNMVLAVVNGDLEVDVDKAYQKVMNEHTYFNRCEEYFTYLGLTEEVEKVKQVYAKIRMDNCL